MSMTEVSQSPPASRSDSYITLTPRSQEQQLPSSSSLAKELLTKKWELAKKKSMPMPHVTKDATGATATTQRDDQGTETAVTENDKKDSPTETDKTSEIDSEVDVPEPDDEDLDGDEDEIGVFPTYLCELHDPKTMLRAEHIQPNRVEITLVTAPKAVTGPNKDKRMWGWGWHSKTTFRYELSVGLARTVFECSPPKVLDVLQALAKESTILEHLKLIETNYFQDTVLGSLKRLYPSAAKLSDEIVEVLEFISDIDLVLLHPAYLNLIGVTKGAVFYKEIQKFVASHDQSGSAPMAPLTSAGGDVAKCLCETYVRSVDRFVDLYKQHEEESARFSVVASESLMWTRGILSFYTDTVYQMDKRNFRPWRGLAKCPIYGFGRRKLFEIVRTSRKEWTFRHVSYGALATLTIERYMHHMNPYHMVAIKRLVPDGEQGNMREENICFVKKSKKVQGYRCLLMSEVITRGRVTTALAIEQAESPEGDAFRHYMTMSEISGTARESVCSSTLSVPTCHYKHSQRIHISGGSDVVAFLCIAASYDVLVGGLSYWKERKY